MMKSKAGPKGSATPRKTKTGRRASPDERARALDVVMAYRAENPEQGELVPDGARIRTFDEESLVAALLYFNNHGTFAGVFDGRHLDAARIAATCGPRFEDKVQAVAQGLAVSESTAARLLRRIK